MIGFPDIVVYYVVVYPLIMSLVWMIGGLLFYYRWERAPRPPLERYPFFSIVVAAHNEEGTIEAVIRSLEDLDYPAYEVLVVNDGSTDHTAGILARLEKEFAAWLKVIHLASNSGKSRAVNVGVLFSKGELLMVIDADSFLDRSALREMAGHFIRYPRVGAVTGNPRIINRTCLLGKIQVGEYSSIIGLIKRSQRILGKVLTVSGVVAAYRRSAFYHCRFFDSDTATEDIDITWKLQKRMWEVRYEPRALCYILSPETVRGLWNQRVRWAKGGLEVIRKHYDIWFEWKHRRFWPVYMEYIGSVLWALSLGGLFVYAAADVLLGFLGFSFDAIPAPSWAGPLMALVCLLQFMVSMFIDSRYEGRSLLRCYFWIIWYPFAYWIISALSIYVSLTEKCFSNGGNTAIWKSPDRGLHTLK